MRTIVFTFIHVFICLYAHSENADSSYADYCVSFEENDTTFDVKFLLVKEYRILEPIRLGTQASFNCDYLSGSEDYDFDVVDKVQDGRRATFRV